MDLEQVWLFTEMMEDIINMHIWWQIVYQVMYIMERVYPQDKRLVKLEIQETPVGRIYILEYPLIIGMRLVELIR